MHQPTPPDQGEQVSLLEPTQISQTSRHRADLTDLPIELAAHTAGFRRSLPQGIPGRPGPIDELLLQQPHRGP